MNNYDPNSAGSAGAILAFFGIMLIPTIIIIVIIIIAYWKVFTKAGKPGWAAIIPIYNFIVLLEIVGKPIWWIFLIIFPCTTWIFGIWTINLLSKSFGKGVGFTIGLLFLGFIFFPILGFGDAKYLGPAGAEGGLHQPFPTQNFEDPNPPQV